MEYKKSMIFLFLPYFLMRNMVFDYRKRKAIATARRRAQKEGRKVLVIQYNRRFYTGTREELRRYNRMGNRLLKRATGGGILVFDYRESVVYVADGKRQGFRMN